jgi:hypothetical protein
LLDNYVPAAEWRRDTWGSFTADGQSSKVAAAIRKTRIADLVKSNI